MASETRLSDTYDRIAQWYDVDMARNMPFDDIGMYAGLAASAGGRVLELGCGNGRILLELMGSGIDAYGIDCSEAMLGRLREKATPRGLAPRSIRFHHHYHTVRPTAEQNRSTVQIERRRMDEDILKLAAQFGHP